MSGDRLNNLPVLSAESLDARRSAPSYARGGSFASDDGKEYQRDLCRCCHCGRIWQWLKGSGRLRGYCQRCHGVTCGPTCPMGGHCVPIEKAVELMEAGVPWHEIPHLADTGALPVSVSVPAEPPQKIILGRG